MSSYPMSATSPGTRRPASRNAWSRPRASRSLAAKTAVGRRSASSAAICSPTTRPARRSSPRPRRCPGGRRRGRPTADRAPSRRLATCSMPVGAADEAEPHVAGGQQVLAGQPAAEPVVDGDRREARRGGQAVDEHHPGPPGPDRLELGDLVADRARRAARRGAGTRRAASAGLAVGVLGAVGAGARTRSCAWATCSTPAATSVKNGLATSRTSSPSIPLRPSRQLAGGVVAHPAELFDHVEDPARGVGVDLVRVVEHVGDRADRHPGQPGDVLQARLAHLRPPSFVHVIETFYQTSR